MKDLINRCEQLVSFHLRHQCDVKVKIFESEKCLGNQKLVTFIQKISQLPT